MTEESTPSHDDLAGLLIAAGNEAVLRGPSDGEALVRRGWPHAGATRTARSISDLQKLRVFKADGFRCRYSGDLLMLPAYLRALSALWPETFPYHPNWRSDVTHEAYWTHTASLEHVNPVAIGGAETEGNWITTSSARNQVRSRYSLEALGWQVRPRDPLHDWDGGVRAFLDVLHAYPRLLRGPHGVYLTRWRSLLDRRRPIP